MAHASRPLLMLSHDEVMRLVDPAQLIDALAQGFVALSQGRVSAPPRPKVDVPGKGFALAMLAWMPGRHIALKTVNVFHGNHALGLESHQALVSLFDADTGAPVAVLDGASITGLRTAAASVLSVRHLARAEARIATVVAAGVQGRAHASMLGLARDFAEIRIVARSEAVAARACEGIANARPMTDVGAAVRDADVICLTTSATTPVIETAWLKPGAHVTSVGFTPPGSEIAADLVERAAVFVETRAAFSPAPVGCVELAGRDATAGTELGEVIAGTRPGRTSADQITLYKSMGHAMEDMVAANLAYAEAVRARAGESVTL